MFYILWKTSHMNAACFRNMRALSYISRLITLQVLLTVRKTSYSLLIFGRYVCVEIINFSDTKSIYAATDRAFSTRPNLQMSEF